MATWRYDVKALEELGMPAEAVANAVDVSFCELGAKKFVESIEILGSPPVNILDLRGADVSLDSLVSICSALGKSFDDQEVLTSSISEPFWLDIGNNSKFSSADVEKELKRRCLRYCIPVRCSRKRCLYGCTLHLSIHVPRQFNMIAVSEQSSKENSSNPLMKPKPHAVPPPAKKIFPEHPHVANGGYPKTSVSSRSLPNLEGNYKAAEFVGQASLAAPPCSYLPSWANTPAPHAEKARPMPPSVPPKATVPLSSSLPPLMIGAPPPFEKTQAQRSPPGPDVSAVLAETVADQNPAPVDPKSAVRVSEPAPAAKIGLTKAPAGKAISPSSSSAPTASTAPAPLPPPTSTSTAIPSLKPPAKSISSQIPPPPPAQRPPPPAPPVIAAASASPLAIIVADVGNWSELRRGDSVYSTCARSSGLDDKLMQVGMFEKFDLYKQSQIMMFTSGCVQVRRQGSKEVGWVEAPNLVRDPCDERAFQLLVGDVRPTACSLVGGVDVEESVSDDMTEGLCDYIDRVVARLGGEVYDVTRRKCFAERLIGSQRQEDRTFQVLLQSLHDAFERSEAGIAMPGDNKPSVPQSADLSLRSPS